MDGFSKPVHTNMCMVCDPESSNAVVRDLDISVLVPLLKAGTKLLDIYQHHAEFCLHPRIGQSRCIVHGIAR